MIDLCGFALLQLRRRMSVNSVKHSDVMLCELLVSLPKVRLLHARFDTS